MGCTNGHTLDGHNVVSPNENAKDQSISVAGASLCYQRPRNRPGVINEDGVRLRREQLHLLDRVHVIVCGELLEFVFVLVKDEQGVDHGSSCLDPAVEKKRLNSSVASARPAVPPSKDPRSNFQKSLIHYPVQLHFHLRSTCRLYACKASTLVSLFHYRQTCPCGGLNPPSPLPSILSFETRSCLDGMPKRAGCCT